MEDSMRRLLQREDLLFLQTQHHNLQKQNVSPVNSFISATIVGSTDGDLDAVRTVSERAADQFTEGKGLVDQITIDSITRKQTTKQEVSDTLLILWGHLTKNLLLMK